MAYRILTAAALLVALSAPAFAADAPPLVIQPGQGTLIQTPAPVGNVFIANPETASVQVPDGAKNVVYVFAKVPGRTSLHALSEDGQIVLSRIIEVPGPRTVRVLRGSHPQEIWTDEHRASPTLADLPPGSSVTMPAGPPSR